MRGRVPPQLGDSSAILRTKPYLRDCCIFRPLHLAHITRLATLTAFGMPGKRKSFCIGKRIYISHGISPVTNRQDQLPYRDSYAYANTSHQGAYWIVGIWGNEYLGNSHMHTLHVQQHNFNAQELAERLVCVTNKHPAGNQRFHSLRFNSGVPLTSRLVYSVYCGSGY